MSRGSAVPSQENSINLVIGEPEENKLMRSMAAAGKYDAMDKLNALSGVAGGWLPTAEPDAISAQEFQKFESVRKGLEDGVIFPNDVNRMIIEGMIAPEAEMMVQDFHDGSPQDLHPDPRLIASLVEQYGGDPGAYLMEQQQLRNYLGIKVPV